MKRMNQFKLRVAYFKMKMMIKIKKEARKIKERKVGNIKRRVFRVLSLRRKYKKI